MLLALKIILLVSLLAIFLQDRKERQVFWWLFAIVILALGSLHIVAVGTFQFAISVLINLGVVLMLLSVLFFYSKKRWPAFSFLEVFGLGDILFIVGLALGFSVVSFITLFIFGIVFSLIIHQVLVKEKQSRNLSTSSIESDINTFNIATTVPLAGYLSLFFAGVLLVHWLGFYDALYLI